MLTYIGGQRKLNCTALWLSVVVLLELGQAASLAEEGDACKIQSHNGICTAASKCTRLESTMKEWGLRRADIVSCGFTVYEELICCPSLIPTTTRSNIIVTTFRPLVAGNQELDANSEYYDFSRLTQNTNVASVDNNELPNRNIWEYNPHTQRKAVNNEFHKISRAWQLPKEVLPFSNEGVAGSERASSSNTQLDPFKRFEFRPQETHMNNEPPMPRTNQMLSHRREISLANAGRDQPFIAQQRRDEIFSNAMFDFQSPSKQEKSIKSFQHQRESTNSDRVDIGVERNRQQVIFTFPNESELNSAQKISTKPHGSINFPTVPGLTSNNVNHMRNNVGVPRSWPPAVSSKEAGKPDIVSDDVLRQRLDELFTKNPAESQQSNYAGRAVANVNNADVTSNPHSSNDNHMMNSLNVGRSWSQAIPQRETADGGVVSTDVLRQRIDQLFTKDPVEFQLSSMNAGRNPANADNLHESSNRPLSNHNHVQNNGNGVQLNPKTIPQKGDSIIGVVSDDVYRQRIDQFFTKNPIEFRRSMNVAPDRMIPDRARQREDEIFRFS